MPEFTFITDENSSITKVQQLIHAITEAIATGVLQDGDALPSVNKLSKESLLSRDTVFKAYSLLKQRNVIASTPTKGYFVTGESYKVFVLLDDFSSFKEQLYNSFRKNLPETYSVDLVFHHYNKDVFESLILGGLGRYSMYVVMNFTNKKIEDVVRKIDPAKLLILDMGKVEKDEFAYICQDFNRSVYKCLAESAPLLKKYNEFVLVYPQKQIAHPDDIVKAFNRFCADYNIRGIIVSSIEESDVCAGTAYWVIKDIHMVKVVKGCRAKGLNPGTEVGILAYNDAPMKEIIDKGITVITSDFEEMGLRAAEYVQNKEKICKILDAKLIIRGSL
ncbi:MAG: GntR family transcriptional regulator [Bacteroidota bacterium]|nr:GntR family transcriptional regulator [Bacteroidota bacterium]